MDIQLNAISLQKTRTRNKLSPLWYHKGLAKKACIGSGPKQKYAVK